MNEEYEETGYYAIKNDEGIIVDIVEGDSDTILDYISREGVKQEQIEKITLEQFQYYAQLFNSDVIKIMLSAGANEQQEPPRTTLDENMMFYRKLELLDSLRDEDGKIPPLELLKEYWAFFSEEN